MSTGIVSLKEGHDESHINDMKLGTKFQNFIDNVTIRLTQKYWHKGCFNCRGKPLSSLWPLSDMTIELEALNRWGGTQYHIGKCILWNTERSDMTYESGSTQRQTDLPNWINEIQTSAMFKGDKKLPFYLQNELIHFT